MIGPTATRDRVSDEAEFAAPFERHRRELHVRCLPHVERGSRIDLVHTMLPEQFVEPWNELYWAPLRARFAGTPSHPTR